MKRKAVFLDRDGVINEAIIRNGRPYPPSSLAELKIVNGAKEVLSALHQDGFLLILVTNQPDVARGITDKKVVEEIHAFLLGQLPIDDIFVCYHDDKDKCNCRKPLPGLILQAVTKYNIDLNSSYMIGDRWRDVEAGKSAGCKTIWLNANYDEPRPKSSPDFEITNSQEVIKLILTN